MQDDRSRFLGAPVGRVARHRVSARLYEELEGRTRLPCDVQGEAGGLAVL